MEADNKITNDEALIEQLLNDRTVDEGIRYLYKVHFDQLSWFVINNKGSWEDAQDVFQEVIVSFIHLVREHKFRGESSIKTILFSMNRNIWFNELKRKKRALEREKKYEQAKEQEGGGMERTMEKQEATDQLIKVMEELGENCKKILLLFYFENQSMKEILSSLAYENEQVVRNKKYKCLKQLEELIESEKGLLQQLKNLLNE